MNELYLHEIYYENNQVTTFDAETPCDFNEGICKIPYKNGGCLVVNMAHVNCISIKHLTFTEEEYEKRQKLLNHEE